MTTKSYFSVYVYFYIKSKIVKTKVKKKFNEIREHDIFWSYIKKKYRLLLINLLIIFFYEFLNYK